MIYNEAKLQETFRQYGSMKVALEAVEQRLRSDIEECELDGVRMSMTVKGDHGKLLQEVRSALGMEPYCLPKED